MLRKTQSVAFIVTTGKLFGAKGLLFLPYLVILSACSDAPAPGSGTGNSCAPVSENQIQDARFETLSAHHSKAQWQASEHAAGGSFESSVSDGTLSIRKTGNEPWFLVAQSADAKVLAGNTLSFSAELKLDLHEPEHIHGFGYGGGLSVLGKRGGKLVVNSRFEHQPHFGVHDWQPVEVIFKLPRNTTYLRLALLHQAGGSMQVRKPALYIVDPDCPTTTKKNK